MSHDQASSAPAYAVPALEKGLRILEDLAEATRPLTIVELAERQGRGRNEIYRMVSCLEAMGYLTRHAESKRYALSLKLLRLAHAHSPEEQLREAAEPELRALAEAIGESCHLSLLAGDSLVVVAQAAGNERIRIRFQIGARFDPLETCSGTLLLSQLSEHERDTRLAASPLWREASATRKKTLLRSLAAPNPDRSWEEASRLRPGVRDIAIAVGGPPAPLAAVTVAHLADRPKAAAPRTILRELRKAARNIETKLGIFPEPTQTEPSWKHATSKTSPKAKPGKAPAAP